MFKYLFIILLIPNLLFSQSKRKLRKLAEAKAKQETLFKDSLMHNLKKHVQYLADDKLEGRRTGSLGEKMAFDYIINEYKKIGLLHTNNNSYVQSFSINEGKSFVNENTFIKVDGKSILLNANNFPLVYSANKKLSSNASIALKESGEVWFFDLKDVLEENKENPHFDLEDILQKEIAKQAANGASGLVIFNSSSIVDNISFNKKSKQSLATIPVFYLHNAQFKTILKDKEATHKIEISVELKDEIRMANNLVGFINNNAENTIILGAHYDHLGFGEDKNALDTANEIHNGADDNASGSAALIELAKILKTSSNTNNNYLIIHFSGEELGLLGSKYWLENPTIKINPNYMINMDMIGRYDTTHKLTIGGFGTSPTWWEILPKVTTSLITKYDSTGGGPSDHASFYRANIPVLFFFTGSHSDYHKTTDDWDKINYEDEANIVLYIKKLMEFTTDKNKISFLKTAEPAMGKSSKFTVSLGVIPDYGYNGTGVKIDGVSPKKLAEKIGLMAGDVLLQLGNFTFTDVMSYMTTLSKFKKGETTKLKVKRKEEILEFDIIF